MMKKDTKSEQNTQCPSVSSKPVGIFDVEDKDFTIEQSKFVYGVVNGWIENADNKVNVSCIIFTGVFGVVTFLSERISGASINSKYWHCLYQVCFIISLILLGISILAYVFAVNPNLGSSGEIDKTEKDRKKFPIYFGDIATIKKSEDYKQKIHEAKDVDFLDELLEEIHYNSRICYHKMSNYKWGLWLSFASIGFAMISWVARFLMYR